MHSGGLRHDDIGAQDDSREAFFRAMVSSGLGMMPTFPSPPYNSVRRVFLGMASRLVSQTGPSCAAPRYRAHRFASALRARRCQRVTLRSVPEHAALLSASTRTAYTARRQRLSLRFGLCCPGPSPLIRPQPPHSRAHRDFAALRLIRPAHALHLQLGDPRRVPCFRCPLPVGMSSSQTPGGSLAAPVPSSFANHAGLRPGATGSALLRFSTIDFSWGS